MNLYLTYYEDETAGEWDDEDRDNQDSHIEWKPLVLALSSSHHDNESWIEIDFEAHEGDLVYLVYARYTDGDSFGQTTGKWEIIGVYPTLELAEAAKESTPGMRKYWGGWFGGLEGVCIEEMEVVPGKAQRP